MHLCISEVFVKKGTSFVSNKSDMEHHNKKKERCRPRSNRSRHIEHGTNGEICCEMLNSKRGNMEKFMLSQTKCVETQSGK